MMNNSPILANLEKAQTKKIKIIIILTKYPQTTLIRTSIQEENSTVCIKGNYLLHQLQLSR